MAESTYARSVRRTLKLALTDTPVVTLLGPRQSGKSTLVEALAPERAYVTLDEEPTLRIAREDPVGFIAALPARVTLDEVKRGPERLLRGCYPPALLRSPERARQWHRQNLRAVLERDVADVARVRDAVELGRLVEIVALRSASLLNLSALGSELGIRRETADQYVSVLERLFLVRRLPAWHRNEAKRLIKTPKIHVLDSGLAATLAGLEAGDWTTRRDRFGNLTESFVVQQLIAQAGWTDSDLHF